MAYKPASTVLDGLLVLDLTQARAGPTSVRQLADWGANVIKIEPPGKSESGDLGRRHGPDFQNLHRNKRSLTLDLKSPDGLAVFRRMAAKADVVAENFRPDTKHRLGVDYESVRAINPRIVYASISGFGQDGPYGNRAGLDQIAQGMGGHMMVTGEAGKGPMRSGAAISDMTAGMMAANGILLALLERGKSGEGQWVQTTLLESQIYLLDFQAARWLIDHKVPEQVGNNHPTNVPMGVFKTSDGYINIAPMPHMWEKMCRAIGAEALLEHPDFQTYEGRYNNRAAVNAAIEEITVAKDSDHWIALLNEAGIPCGPIYTLDKTFADPQVKHLGIANAVESPVLGKIEVVGQPVHLGRTPSKIVAPAPEYGEHTYEVLGEFGYSAEEIADLRNRGLV